MRTFHVKQQIMMVDTIAVEAESEEDARRKVEVWEDCETIESEPTGNATIISVTETEDA